MLCMNLCARRRSLVCAFAVAFLLAGGVPAHESRADAAFQKFVESMWPQARAKGVSLQTYRRAFHGLGPDPKVWEKANYQPEYIKPIWQYLANAVNDTRIQKGMEMLQVYKPLLDAIEAKYGVDRHVVIAIWGMETRYGEYLGDYNVIQALATLGYRGNRRSFGRTQLLAALQILENGDIEPQNMMGSWAGAMGQTQFIPTTYDAYAVDFTGDGKRDIWRSIPDALASTANYLRVSKWKFGQTWGYEVEMPRGFNRKLANNKTIKTIAQWQALGVKRVRGQQFPRSSDRAALYAPAGPNGPAFLTLNNFRSILRYNVAPAYALAVGYLSDRIRGFPPFVQSWPTDAVPLQEKERFELQNLLAARGYEIGEIDGVIGSKTEAAVRDYQRSNGLPEDGFPSVQLLQRLRKES